MTRIVLYRHGQTEENRRHILQGCTPGTLTDEGRQMIRQSAEQLARQYTFDRIIASDLRRCQDTAAILNERLNLPLEFTPMLRERDWGSATGMNVGGGVKIKIPDDAESIESMKARSQAFLDYVRSHYPGQTILAVSHGLICRFIQAVHYGVEKSDIEPMTNCETREITLD